MTTTHLFDAAKVLLFYEICKFSTKNQDGGLFFAVIMGIDDNHSSFLNLLKKAIIMPKKKINPFHNQYPL